MSARLNLRGLILPLGLLFVAEFAAWATNLQSDSLAAPSQIAVAFWEALWDGTLLVGTYETLACAFAGLLIGFGVGLLLGVLVGLFRWLDRVLEVSIEIIRPIPPVALIPIALLVYGFGYRMEISIVAFAVVWPALILTRAAITAVEPRLMEVARVLRLGLVSRIIKIFIPAALPRIFVALRLAVGISLIVAITVEISANTLGMGHSMMAAGQSLRPALMLAFLLWIGVLGWAMNALMLAVQQRLFAPMMGTSE